MSAAKAILHGFGTFGCPQLRQSDNRREFVDDKIKELFYIIGMKSKITLTNSHQESAIIESANKEVHRQTYEKCIIL